MNYTVKQFRYLIIILVFSIYLFMRYDGYISSYMDEWFIYIGILLLWWYNYSVRSNMMTVERLEEFYRCSKLEYRYHVNTSSGLLDSCLVRVKGFGHLWYELDRVMTCGELCRVNEFESYCKYHSTVGELLDGMRDTYHNDVHLRRVHDLDLYDYRTAKWFSLFWIVLMLGIMILVLHRNELGLGMSYYYY